MPLGPVTLRDGIVGGSSFILGAGAGYAARGKWAPKPAAPVQKKNNVGYGIAGLAIIGVTLAAKKFFGKKKSADANVIQS